MLSTKNVKKKASSLLNKCACSVIVPTSVTAGYALTSLVDGNVKYEAIAGVAALFSTIGISVDVIRYFNDPSRYKPRY